MTYSGIVGTGSYLPERVVDNDEFARRLDTSDAWIRERTGIVQRHIAEKSQGCIEVRLIAELDHDAIPLLAGQADTVGLMRARQPELDPQI